MTNPDFQGNSNTDDSDDKDDDEEDDNAKPYQQSQAPICVMPMAIHCHSQPYSNVAGLDTKRSARQDAAVGPASLTRSSKRIDNYDRNMSILTQYIKTLATAIKSSYTNTQQNSSNSNLFSSKMLDTTSVSLSPGISPALVKPYRKHAIVFSHGETLAEKHNGDSLNKPILVEEQKTPQMKIFTLIKLGNLIDVVLQLRRNNVR